MTTKSNLTANDFQGQILKETGPIAVLYDANWCPFCRAFRSVFQSLQKASVPIAIVDLSDLNNPLWETFGVNIVPTVLLFNSGKIIQRFDGVPGIGLNPIIIQEITSKLKSVQKP